MSNQSTTAEATAKASKRLTPLEKKWVLYDVANSAYVLLATALLAFYRDYVAPTGSLTNVWGWANIIVTIISIFLCPILGTLADFSQKRKFFIIFAGIGIGGCGVLSLFSALTWWSLAGVLFLVVYIITEVGLSSSNVFYDSMLSDITTDERMHNVSANGYAWGYIGSCIPFVFCLVLYVLCSMIESLKPYLGLAFSLCCLLTAVWWFVFTLPLYKSYKQKYFLPKPDNPIKATFTRLGSLFKELAKNKKALFFLIAFFFYIDGVHTIIKMAMTIGSDLFDFGAGTAGLVKLVLALFVTQIVAFPAAIIFGRLASKISSEKLLISCIIAYTFVGVLAVFMNYEWQFWVMAIIVGMFQGGVQAMSRSYFTKIIPANKTGEFFGIYDIFGKSAAVLGLWLITTLSDPALFPLSPAVYVNYALIPLPVLFLIGLAFFIYSMKIPATQVEETAEENTKVENSISNED